jgi:hypothetical protein
VGEHVLLPRREVRVDNDVPIQAVGSSFVLHVRARQRSTIHSRAMSVAMKPSRA